jgi:hypothetical protein
VASVAASYAYFLANAGPDEAKWLAEEILSRFKTRILETLRDVMTSTADGQGSPRENRSIAGRVDFLVQCHERALNSLLRLADVDVSPWQEEGRAFAARELSRLEGLISERQAEPPSGPWEREAATIVPRRLCPGPVDIKNFTNRMTDEEHESWWRVYKRNPGGTYSYPALLLYWADGKRSVQEISDLIELEAGQRVTELLVTCCQLWDRLGLVKLSVVP